MTQQRPAYGGQAVIEGVMIRGRNRVVTACRRNDGSIAVRRDDADGLTQRYTWLRLAFLRGMPALIDSFQLGYRTLMWSADLAMEGEQQQKPSGFVTFLTFLASFALGIGLFVLFPTLAVNWVFPGAKALGHHGGTLLAQLIPTPGAILPNIFEGLLRLLILVGYILVIGRSKDIRRVFSYHGAEHKVVNAWEGSGELTVEEAKRYSRIHPRCGTSFLFLVFVVGIIIHALLGWPDSHLLRMATRLVMLPIVVGVAYELIRLSGRFRDSRFVQALISPGLLLQRLTTAEPNDEQIAVALHAMRTVLEDEGVVPPLANSSPEQPSTGPVATT